MLKMSVLILFTKLKYLLSDFIYTASAAFAASGFMLVDWTPRY